MCWRVKNASICALKNVESSNGGEGEAEQGGGARGWLWGQVGRGRGGWLWGQVGRGSGWLWGQVGGRGDGAAGQAGEGERGEAAEQGREVGRAGEGEAALLGEVGEGGEGEQGDQAQAGAVGAGVAEAPLDGAEGEQPGEHGQEGLGEPGQAGEEAEGEQVGERGRAAGQGDGEEVGAEQDGAVVATCPCGQVVKQPARGEEDPADAGQQVDHLFLVVGKAVGVELLADGGVLGFLFLVLVEHPINRAAVAEAIGPRFRRHTGERGFAVERDDAGGRVGAQQRFRCEARRACLFIRHIAARERVGRNRLVTDVQVHQRLAPRGPVFKVGHRVAVKRNARKLTLQVQRIFLAIHRVVQHGIAVVKDVFFGDALGRLLVTPATAGIQVGARYLNLPGLDSHLRGSDSGFEMRAELL